MCETNEIVYVLTNAAMPGLVKIGKTTQKDVALRMRQLYTTGVPIQFDCEYACLVHDCTQVEKALHDAFGDVRLTPKREFFSIKPERIISILKLLSTQDVTPQVEEYLEENISLEEKKSTEKFKSNRRPPLNFSEMNIPIGALLLFKDNETEVIVSDEKKVMFNGSDCSLTQVTKELLDLSYAIQPTPHWTYEGKKLIDIYEETYIVD